MNKTPFSKTENIIINIGLILLLIGIVCIFIYW